MSQVYESFGVFWLFEKWDQFSNFLTFYQEKQIHPVCIHPHTSEERWLPETTWHVLFMGQKIQLSSGSGPGKPLNLDRFLRQNCISESSWTLRPWHFRSRLLRHLRSQYVTRYLGLLSVLDVYDLAGTRASGNVRHAHMLCCVLFARVCVEFCGCWDSGNSCLHTLLTLSEQIEESPDKLLIKAITKLCEKSQVCCGIQCLCGRGTVRQKVRRKSKRRRREGMKEERNVCRAPQTKCDLIIDEK